MERRPGAPDPKALRRMDGDGRGQGQACGGLEKEGHIRGLGGRHIAGEKPQVRKNTLRKLLPLLAGGGVHCSTESLTPGAELHSPPGGIYLRPTGGAPRGVLKLRNTILQRLTHSPDDGFVPLVWTKRQERGRLQDSLVLPRCLFQHARRRRRYGVAAPGSTRQPRDSEGQIVKGASQIQGLWRRDQQGGIGDRPHPNWQGEAQRGLVLHRWPPGDQSGNSRFHGDLQRQTQGGCLLAPRP
mmetsp:Transcript_26199/g.59239  ORF Transcript_26199/g.59239 Transcript_26199/m.59239 type:complete len:241 (+) Transcript_26199:840-1562(+)